MGNASRKARFVSETLTLPTRQNEFDRPLGYLKLLESDTFNPDILDKLKAVYNILGEPRKVVSHNDLSKLKPLRS